MVYPVEALRFRNWYHRLLGRILYRCEEYNWHGYIVRKQGIPPILWIVIAIRIMSLIMVLIQTEWVADLVRNLQLTKVEF